MAAAAIAVSFSSCNSNEPDPTYRKLPWEVSYTIVGLGSGVEDSIKANEFVKIDTIGTWGRNDSKDKLGYEAYVICTKSWSQSLNSNVSVLDMFKIQTKPVAAGATLISAKINTVTIPNVVSIDSLISRASKTSPLDSISLNWRTTTKRVHMTVEKAVNVSGAVADVEVEAIPE